MIRLLIIIAQGLGLWARDYKDARIAKLPPEEQERIREKQRAEDKEFQRQQDEKRKKWEEWHRRRRGK